MSLPLGHELTIDFNGQGILFFIAFLLSSVLVLWTNRAPSKGSALSGPALLALRFFRILLVFLFLLLLFDPTLELRRTFQAEKKIAFLMDDSKSMQKAWQGEESALAVEVSDIYEKLSEHHDVDVWNISGESLDGPSVLFEASHSSFLWDHNKDEIKEKSPGGYAAIYLVSDGHFTGGRSPLDAPWLESTSLYPLLPLPPKSNLSLGILNAELIGQTDSGANRILVQYEQDGLEGRSLRAGIFSKGVRIHASDHIVRSSLGEMQLAVEDGFENDGTELVIKLEVPGTSIQDERTLSMAAEPEATKVFLLSARVNPLHKFLLKRTRSLGFDIETHISSISPNESSLSELEDFDLVIVNGLPDFEAPSETTKPFEEALAADLPLVLFSNGANDIPDRISSALSATMTVEPTSEDVGFLQWSQEALNHPVYLGLLGEGISSQDVLRLPPVRSSISGLSTDAKNLLKLTGSQNVGGLWISEEKPRAMMFGADLWKMFFLPESEQFVTGLWRVLLAYLGEMASFDPVMIRMSQTEMSTGSHVPFEVRVNDLGARVVEDAELRVWQVSETQLTTGLDVQQKRPGVYGATLDTRIAGSQMVIAEALRFGEVWGRDTLEVNLLSFQGEDRTIGVNLAFLSRLASKGEGKLVHYYAEDLPPIKKESFSSTEELSWPGLRSIWILVMLLTILFAEWIIRRRQGLL